jgi:putative ABC transport system permease protein
VIGWYGSWRAALRIARRDAWRAKGRSLLVLSMIALPILGVSAADVTLRSVELSTLERLDRRLGGADAGLTDLGRDGRPLYQSPRSPDHYRSVDETEEGAAVASPAPSGTGPVDVRKVLPSGATVITDTSSWIRFGTEHGLIDAGLRELNAADPMAKGILTLKQGRFPRSADEVATTTAFLKVSGLRVGGDLSVRHLKRGYRIVGSYEYADDLRAQEVNALPGAMLAAVIAAEKKAGLPDKPPQRRYLVKLDGGFTWNMVLKANSHGLTVDSRSVAQSPPPDSEVPLFTEFNEGMEIGTSAAQSVSEVAMVGTVVALVILEICLLAGPAFAVGARRSRRQLGLVGANGGDRRHIRAIVLAGGVVIGVAAAVVGTGLGVLLTILLQPYLEEFLGQRFGSFDLRPLELLGIAALAVFTGTMAALIPAVTASRQPVLVSLTGRRGVRRTSRVLPVVGLIAIAVGSTIALGGSLSTDDALPVTVGAVIAELGVVALTPALVGLFGRLGRFLPLSPRLALRDAVRNRGRTAPAVAAVLAAVAGTVAVATYTASDEARLKAAYTAQLPHGAVMVMDNQSSRDVPTIRNAVQRSVSVKERADIDRIVATGDPTCPLYSGEARCGFDEVLIPQANRCPMHGSFGYDHDKAAAMTVAERRRHARDWRCGDEEGGGLTSRLTVSDDRLLRVLGISDPAAEEALKAGRAVVLDRRFADAGGKVRLKLGSLSENERWELMQKKQEVPGKITAFDAHVVSGSAESYGIAVIISSPALKEAGIATVPYGAYFSTEKVPDSAQQQRLNAEIAKVGEQVDLTIEKGYESQAEAALLILALFAGLITIGAAGIATGLAQADAEADLRTLAAVGAPARVRRTLSGFQCGVVALMGVVLGSASGMLPAVGLVLTERRMTLRYHEEALDQGFVGEGPYMPIVMPWTTLLALVIAVPVGAALLAALVTRSRGALARRAAS